MQVTQKNFCEAFDIIKSIIKDTEFISLDLEMTGIKCLAPEILTDTPAERYSKMSHALICKYRIIQVGLCFFTKINQDSFLAYPFNFYVFPRESYGFSPQILIDASAADFNIRHNMDWNKWFNEGVTYMSMKEAARREDDNEKIEITQEYENTGIKLTKPEDIKKFDKIQNDIEEWIKKNTKEAFIIDDQNKFFRKYIYEFLRSKYPKIFIETIPKKDRPQEKEIYLYNFDEKEIEIHNQCKKKEKEKLLTAAKGFTNVFELIVKSKIKLIGHNMYFDTLFLYSHFYENLPNNYYEFKNGMHKLFPEVYDTKFIVNQTHLKEILNSENPTSSLETVFRTINDFKNGSLFKHKKIKLAPKFESYDLEKLENMEFCHEAGYDALLTGACYANMIENLTEEEKIKVRNSISVMRSMKYLKLDGSDDPFYNENSLIYIISKPADESEALKYKDLISIFEKTSIIEEEFRIIVTNNETTNQAFLILNAKNEKNRTLFTDKIYEQKKKGFEIATFAEYSLKIDENKASKSKSKKYGQPSNYKMSSSSSNNSSNNNNNTNNSKNTYNKSENNYNKPEISYKKPENNNNSNKHGKIIITEIKETTDLPEKSKSSNKKIQILNTNLDELTTLMTAFFPIFSKLIVYYL